MAAKTNAARILDQHKISYELKSYKVDQTNLSAKHVAQTLGIDVNTIYKTLVLVTDTKNVLVALIAGDTNLNLKKLAKAANVKSCQMLPIANLLAVTGYVRGGCSPLGMKKQYQTFIDNSAINKKQITISAGKPGLQIVINTTNLQILTKAVFCDLI